MSDPGPGGETGNGLRQVFSGLNPERILVGALCGVSDGTRWPRPPTMRAIARSGPRPSASTRVCRIRSPNATSMSRSPGWRPDCRRNCPTATRRAWEAANIAKYAASEAALKALDQAIQVHGGNGLSHEYGLSELWFVTRLMRTAPVSREMVLNFVAQTSLGLPRFT